MVAYNYVQDYVNTTFILKSKQSYLMQESALRLSLKYLYFKISSLVVYFPEKSLHLIFIKLIF